MLFTTSQDIQFKPTDYFVEQHFYARRSRECRHTHCLPTNAFVHIQETPKQPPRKILFVNISHVKTNFKRMLRAGRRVLWQHWPENWHGFASMPQITWVLYEKANESWRKSWVSIHEDAAWSCGEVETSSVIMSWNPCLCVMNAVCCKLGFRGNKVLLNVGCHSEVYAALTFLSKLKNIKQFIALVSILSLCKLLCNGSHMYALNYYFCSVSVFDFFFCFDIMNYNVY